MDPCRSEHRAAEPPQLTLEAIWNALNDAIESAKHPFHTAALATVSADSRRTAPEVRTVVLRYADRERWTVGFNSDLRSPKIREIQGNRAVSLLLYDAPGKWQLRLRGIATIHNRDAAAARRWETVSIQSRECYRETVGPSTPLSGEPAAESSAGEETPPLLSEEAGYENFCFVTVAVTEVETLYLHHRGHRRRKWIAGADGIRTIDLSP